MHPANSDLDPFRSEGDLNLSSRRAEWAERNLNAETRRWLDEDAKYFLHQSLSTPCLDVLTGCAGAGLTTLQGRELLDFHGNNVHQAGFGHPRVLEAIKSQLDALSFCPRRYTNIPAIKLAKKLAELAPGNLKRVLFAPGGTSAMGMAIKLARTVTGRFKTISMWDAFHGASLDAISVGGEAIFRNGIGPLLPGCEHVPPPDHRHCPFRCGNACYLSCADYVEYVLEKEGDIAAVIAETVRSTPIIPPKEYWPRLRAACDKHGALLILDEIPHCLGRTGRMFTCEHFDVVPDALVLGKGLGGAVFPLAALLAREDLNEAVRETALGHYTHEKNPVACAAGLAAIEVIEKENLLAHAQSLGAYALGRLRELMNKYEIIGHVQGLGLLLGIELVKDRTSRTRAIDEAEFIMYRALEKGLNFKLTMGNMIALTPALTITRPQMDRALDILDQCFAELS
jgi:4-aminobutyrate aminotransferase